MANGNQRSGGGGGSRGSGGGNGSPNDVIAFVIFAFVLIFVVLLYAMGVRTSPNIVGDSIFRNIGGGFLDTWRKTVNPILIVIDLVLFGVIIFSIIKVWPYRPKLTLFYKRQAQRKKKGPDYRKFKRSWKKIIARLEEGAPDSFRLAVIDADAFVDAVLKAVGYTGDHLADRLSQIIPGELENLEGVWRAHRLRNNLVHAHGIVVTQREAEEALNSYEKFLKEIGIL